MDEHREDPQVAALLRNSRPEPDAAFRSELERQLFEPKRSWFTLPALPRPALAGTGLALLLAALLLALGLVGGGPLSGDDRVRATENCRQVTVTRVQRVPRIVTDASGNMRIEHYRQRVPRVVTRCTTSK